MDRGGHYYPHLVHDVCPVPADHSWGGGREPPLQPAELRRGEGRQGSGREDDIGSRHIGGVAEMIIWVPGIWAVVAILP